MEKIKKEEIGLRIPTQISKEFLPNLAKALDFPMEKIVDITSICEDTLTTSVLLALQHAKDKDLVKPGTKVAFMNFGSGISISGAIYNF